MDKFIDWIKRHQLAAFYILAFAISWGLGFSYGAVVKRSQHRLLPLVSLASCGPALAGIIISALINTKPKEGTRKAYWIAFLVALPVSAAIHSAYLLLYGRFNYSPAEIGFRLLIVLPVAFIISTAYSRIPELKKYLSSLVRFRGVWGWVLMALLFYPVTVLLSLPISRILGMRTLWRIHPLKKALRWSGGLASNSYKTFYFSTLLERKQDGAVLPCLICKSRHIPQR